MNKQEVIEKLEYLKLLLEEGSKDNYNHGFINALTYALNVTKELDEPEKPVLTEEEAEWVEGLKDEQKRRPFWTKYSMLYFVTRAGFGYGFSYDNDREDREVELEHYSHEISAEKEREYTIRLKGIDGRFNWLMYDTKLKIYVLGAFGNRDCQNIFTEKQLSRDGLGHVLYNDAFEVIEVEE